MQTAGDCHLAVCNGSGGTTTAVDDNDLPDDQNACTDNVCTVGTASFPNKSTGTACGTGGKCNASAECVGCLSPSDCPGTDDDCQSRTCSAAGVCGTSYQAAGTPLPAGKQVAGNCREARCDGAGGVTSANDNSHTPVDAKQCTGDVCTNGVPSNPPLDPRATCGVDDLCDGAGSCVECLLPSDCPGADSSCQVRTCTQGVCGVSNTAAGVVLTDPSTGDCHGARCDGNGQSEPFVNDLDVGPDTNECTNEVCNAGVASHQRTVPTRRAAPGGAARSSATSPATCVGCHVLTIARVSATSARSEPAHGGTCGFTLAAVGQAGTTAQTAGDCQVNQCDGAGASCRSSQTATFPPTTATSARRRLHDGVLTPEHRRPATGLQPEGGGSCDAPAAASRARRPRSAPAATPSATRARATRAPAAASDVDRGHPVDAQTAGDCQQDQCDGNGGIVRR